MSTPTPHQVLRWLLEKGAPKSDAGELAQRLLRRHGSLAPVLESHAQDLVQSESLPEAAAQLLSLIPQLARYVERARLMECALPIVNVQRAGEYLRAQYIGVRYEQVYLLSLDGEGRLLECALVQQGTLDETPFYLRNILEYAARAGAQAMVISHNHPGGAPYPSRQDVNATMGVLQTTTQLGLLLLDHIIIADGVTISMHRDGPIPKGAFLTQNPQSALLHNWLSPA